MVVNVLDILTKTGDTIVNRIRENLASTGSNATGETSRTLRVETINASPTSQKLMIFGRAYFFSVETGRKATPQYTKPSETFVAKIQAWMNAKGKEGSAYAIAKGIHAKGTKLFQDGGRQDIVSNVVNKSLTDQLSKEILDRYAQEFLKNAVKLSSSGNNSN